MAKSKKGAAAGRSAKSTKGKGKKSAGADTKGKKSASASAPARRGRQPRVVDPYPFVFDFRRPVADPETEIEFGKALADGKKPDPNKGLMTRDDYRKAFESAKLALDEGKSPPASPPAYSMIRRGAARELAGRCIVSGHSSKARKPAPSWGIPEKMVETFGENDRVFTTKSGGKDVPDSLRCCHAPDARKLVLDEKYIVTIGKSQYVVGDAETPGILAINGSDYGNYGANIMAGKELSFANLGNKISNLVGRFNNNWGILPLDDGSKPHGKMAIGPNMAIDAWGHLSKGDKVLTPDQIRKAVESGDVTGIKFEALYSPTKDQLVGEWVGKSALWQAVKRRMDLAATKRKNTKGDETTALERFKARKSRGKTERDISERGWSNLIDVQTRTNPTETFPFGLFNSQTLIVPVVGYGDDLNTVVVRFVIGSTVGWGYTEERHEAEQRLHPEWFEDAETEESEAAPVSEVEAETEPASA